MEDIEDLGSFKKCRLCGVNGFHKMDILDIDSPTPCNASALSEKIFRCVGIRVERNDKLTSKICGICFEKINEFWVFRRICVATNIQLKMALSSVMGEAPSADTAEEANTMLEVVVEAQNASFGNFELCGQGPHVPGGVNDDMDSVEAKMSKRQTLPNESFPLRSVDLDGVDANGTDCAANEHRRIPEASPTHYKREERQLWNFEYDVHAQDTSVVNRKPQTSTSATPTIWTSFDNDDCEDQESDADVDAKGTQNDNAPAKQKAANNEVKCMAFNEGKCKESFGSWDAMMYHVTNYHVKGIKKTFECHLCQQSYSSTRDIRYHVQSAHIGLKPLECPNLLCSKKYTKDSDLKRHIDSVHLNQKPFECSDQLCSMRFSQKSSLTRHIKTVHFGLKSFVCPNRSCSKKFAAKSNLKQHIDSHSGLQPFKCPVLSCSKKFSRKHGLKRHLDSVHSGQR